MSTVRSFGKCVAKRVEEGGEERKRFVNDSSNPHINRTVPAIPDFLGNPY